LRTDIEVGYIPGMITRGYLRTAPNIAWHCSTPQTWDSAPGFTVW
jgi:hypothetical protein